MLSVDERNLLSVAYKNVVGVRRASWRTLYTKEGELQDKLSSLDPPYADGRDNREGRDGFLREQCTFCRDYRVRVERELVAVCRDLLQLLTRHALPHTNQAVASAMLQLGEQVATGQQERKGDEGVEDWLRARLAALERTDQLLSKVNHGEDLVFLLKMVGDYHRFLAEFNVEDEAQRARESLRALTGYYVGAEIAAMHLSPTNPLRLGLAFNFSVFYYEIMSQPARACQLAKNAYDEVLSLSLSSSCLCPSCTCVCRSPDQLTLLPPPPSSARLLPFLQAIGELDQSQKHTTSYKDSLLVMKLLRHSLSQWTA